MNFEIFLVQIYKSGAYIVLGINSVWNVKFVLCSISESVSASKSV